MATVTGFTSARMLEIERSCVVSGAVDLNGRLQLSTRGGIAIDAGLVKGERGDPGIQGPAGLDANYVPIAIGSNVNLNTMVTAGFYTQQLTAQASTALNYPTNIAGLLEVSHNPTQSMIYQRYTSYMTDNVWIRSRYQNVWNDWYLVVVDIAAWTPISLNSNVRVYGTAYPCAWRRIGNEIQWKGLIGLAPSGNFLANTSYTAITVMPAGARPLQTSFFVGSTSTGQSNASLVVSAGGTVDLRMGNTVGSFVSLDNVRYSLV